jgi:hypothetical protein
MQYTKTEASAPRDLPDKSACAIFSALSRLIVSHSSFRYCQCRRRWVHVVGTLLGTNVRVSCMVADVSVDFPFKPEDFDDAGYASIEVG